MVHKNSNYTFDYYCKNTQQSIFYNIKSQNQSFLSINQTNFYGKTQKLRYTRKRCWECCDYIIDEIINVMTLY